MTTTLKGKAAFDAFFAELPANLERNVLRGALRAGAEVIAAEARATCRSSVVSQTIKTSSRAEKGLVTAKVKTQGPGDYLAPWLEFGTSPHLIKVRRDLNNGASASSINRAVRKGSLKIGGRLVGPIVMHPGAGERPFLRPAIDSKANDAIAAMAAYVTTRLTKEGLRTPPPAEEPDE